MKEPGGHVVLAPLFPAGEKRPKMGEEGGRGKRRTSENSKPGFSCPMQGRLKKTERGTKGR